MKAQVIKEFAKLIAQQDNIDNKIIDYIMNRLNLSDMKLFKYYFNQELKNNKLFVEVTSSSNNIKDTLHSLFPNKKIEIHENKSLGAGIYLIDGDNHYDLSFRNKIDQIIEDLKN